MAAYAALVSCMNVLSKIQNPACPASFDKSQTQSLGKKVSFLVDFLEKNSTRVSKDLERKMVTAAYAAEDIIESYVVDRIHSRSTSNTDEVCALVRQDLEKALQRMDLIVQETMEVNQKKRKKVQLPRSSVHVESCVPVNETTKMVGFAEEMLHLVEQITSHNSSRKIIPVVGMGGIGKTTLARNAYEHSYVMRLFDIRAWITVSQDYTVEEIIRTLLREIGFNEMGHMTEEELGDKLYKSLYGMKYLIILDDVWSNLAWYGIRNFIPDNNNNSRILLTTRLLDVATSIGTCNPRVLKFLDGDQSWVLLRMKVFDQRVCPPELEELGKKIAYSCKGLPLTIVVIGGLLKMSEKTQGYWEYVSENISSITSKEDDEYCLEILSLSYHQLPVHLKPCFLYLATFPEDYAIHIFMLTMLWVADGFLRPTLHCTLEEVALDNLKDLASRNLITFKRYKWRKFRGKKKVCIVHDLIRELCVREAQKEGFIYVRKEIALDNQETEESPRRFVAHPSGPKFCPSMPPTRLARSLVAFGKLYIPPNIPSLSLVRVIFSSRKYSLENVMQFVNSRALTCSVENKEQLRLFSSVSLLWNLETLIVDKVFGDFTLPREVWELRHLKHLIIKKNSVLFPDPLGAQTEFVLDTLQTFKTIRYFCFSDEVLRTIPNIKKLGISYDRLYDVNMSPCFSNVVHCRKLETLKCEFLGTVDHLVKELETLKLPHSLRKLTLCSSKIQWGNMTIVGSLPNLEVLKLDDHGFCGVEWNTNEGEFQSLKFLEIDSCFLMMWTVDDCSHFPKLEHLILRKIRHLEEIPPVFGESTTLRSILLYTCLDSVYTSAEQILEEQQSIGNEDFHIDLEAPF